MLEMGIIVGLGLIVTFVKMSWRWKMKMLSYPVAMDLIVFIALLFLHWGSFSGVMVATIGALFCSMTLSVGRWMFGHVDKGVYTPGLRNVRDFL